MVRRKIVLILLLAFIFRIFLMLWSFQHPLHKDILRFRDWAIIPYLYELTDPYEAKHITFGIDPLNLPPGTLYILTSVYRVNILAARVVLKVTHAAPGALQWVNGELTNAFLRLPAMVSDLLTGYLIYALVKKYKDEKNALLASTLYLFNPAVLYNSSFWGQMDAINNTFLILALFLFFQKKTFWAVLTLFLSLYVKLTLIVVIGPLMAVWLWLTKNKRQFLLYFILSTAIILILTLPVSRTPHLWFIHFLQTNSLGEMNNITSLAFNVWWVVFKPRVAIGIPTSDFSFTLDRFIGSPASTVVYFGLPLFTWAMIITAVVLLPLVRTVFALREKFLKPQALFLVLSLLSLVGFLFLPHMHERYLFPFLVLMAVSVGLTRRYLWGYVALSLLNFLNLYIIWHPMRYPSLPYALMNSVDFQWLISVATVATGMVMYVKGLKDLRTAGDGAKR